MPIVTLTLNPAVDLSCEVGQVVPERKLRCGEPLREPGGGGVNVARAVGRLGGSARAVFPAGGATGEALRQLIAAERAVEETIVDIAGWTRESVTVTETSTGQQFRFTMPGPTLAAGEWQACLDAALDATGAGDYLVVSGSLPPGVPDTLPGDVAERAREVGARLVVDTSGAPLGAAARSGAYLLKPNAGELARLVGADHLAEHDVERAARQVVESDGAEVVVTSLGAGGALVVAGGGLSERVSAPMVPVRSKVGAGDSMVAGIVLALSRGEPLAAAVRFGVAAGAAAVMTAGTELARREDAERLHAQLAG